MTVSKRLRFEILRRDNHQCRYCGRSAPEWPITVDHVLPSALGGNDDPANLVAACRDCNAGKSSMPADAAIVADVAVDALRWARAMEIVATGRAVDRMERAERYDAFLDEWNAWTYNHWTPQGTQKCTFDLPGAWRSSIDQFIEAGLETDDLGELVDVAMSARSGDVWRYFCGCCWRRIRESQELAGKLVRMQEERGDPIG